LIGVSLAVSLWLLSMAPFLVIDWFLGRNHSK
jgi:hypothetical protein